jgi:hypothetical protein
MVFIYRKSIKAGPFRINLSKCWAGLSTGVPGFRVTQSSGGEVLGNFEVNRN